MSVMILDAGNSIIKAKIARRERGEVAFSHALKQLTEAEYTNVVPRQGSPDHQLAICVSMICLMWLAKALSGMGCMSSVRGLRATPAITMAFSPLAALAGLFWEWRISRAKIKT